MRAVTDLADRLLASRRDLVEGLEVPRRSRELEGGCGVIGVASTVPIKGRHLLQSLVQMHNRGNGKGGGIAAIGLSARQLGVPKRVLEDYYILQIAYLDPGCRKELEKEFVEPYFDVYIAEELPSIGNYKSIGLEVKPPTVWRYLVKVDEDVLERFIERNGLWGIDPRRAEDELIFRNSFALNKKYYASLGEKKAFVVSHGKDMIVLKIVGYAEQVVKYYQLEELEARVWIGHQRYPTKGKVWHPGGAHPFIGVHDALVHNGDFANYYSITEYLRQRNYYPLFLTDTEVAALYWDLLTRMYRYPLEYAIEAIAPTTERDFYMLPEEKRKVYRAIQVTHIHGSPDGPWFFIIGRNDPYNRRYQLIGITDTSMLRPQVFALQEGYAKIGLIASERQAIDALLRSLAMDDDRFYPLADLYWYARGGSYTDGGAFIFTVDHDGKDLVCTDKFGKIIATNKRKKPCRSTCRMTVRRPGRRSVERIDQLLSKSPNYMDIYRYVVENLAEWSYDDVFYVADRVRAFGERGDLEAEAAIKALTLLIDCRYYMGDKKRSCLVSIFEDKLFELLSSMPPIRLGRAYCLINWETRNMLRPPKSPRQVLVIDAHDFAPEGDDGICGLVDEACMMGWSRIIAYNFKGQRNFGAGLIAKNRIRIDVYGRVGDCLAAFADGAEFYVHGSVQDSVAYCFRSGKIVIYGDAGKAFEYGAKGGVAFILGDLIDRPLINAVGSATAVVNGSCKDYMGESFMAAKGLIIINGVKFDEDGKLIEEETPYHGGNLFSLAAAGAVYLRDPRKTVGEDQLNGGKIVQLSRADWERILPLLKENEKLFGIKVKDLLTVDGKVRRPEEVYRKVIPVEVAALTRYER